MAVGMAPFLPYIVSAPAWLFATGLHENEADEMLTAYIIGIVGYTVANIALAADLALRFDQRSGRTVDVPLSNTAMERLSAKS